MKNKEKITTQMDEIIFEHRNKLYGAYILRKMYNTHLNRALLLSVAILFASLAYPVVTGHYAHNNTKYQGNDGLIEIMPMANPKEEVVPPPPPPPRPVELEQKVKFVTPKVTIDEFVDDGGILNQDFLNQTTENSPVEKPDESAAEKKAEMIEIPEAQKEIFIMAEEMPSYPGGDAERQKFLADNIQYPQQAAEAGLQGNIYIEFVVDSKGNITDVKILRGIGGGCDEEAIRVIKMMPQWHPGKQNGKTVRVLYHMAIGFQLRS
jgi:protein TonB